MASASIDTDVSASAMRDQAITSPDSVIDGPLSLKAVILILAIMGAVMYAHYSFVLSREQTHQLGLAVVALVLAMVALAWCFARRRAGQRLRAEPSLPLTSRVWLSGRARTWAGSFDAAMWISETGPDGPRVINGGSGPIDITPDPNAHEVIDLAASISRSFVRSKAVWLNVGIFTFILLVSLQPFLATARLTSIPVERLLLGPGLYALILLFTLHSLGWIPLIRRLILVSPGRIEYTNWGRSLTFTRADSVIYLMPAGKNWKQICFLRADGRHARIYLFGPSDQILNTLLARWSHPSLTSATASRTPPRS